MTSWFRRKAPEAPPPPERVNFRIGQMVVCIYGASAAEPPPYVEVGRIYTISGFCMNPHHWGVIGVHVEEIAPFDVTPDYYCNCFVASCFRPVKETNISVFRDLVAPRPKSLAVVGPVEPTRCHRES
jgi:hypothetical protein